MSSDLEALLKQYEDLVRIHFWQENRIASAYMARLRESLQQFCQVTILKLLLADPREWAHMHGVDGVLTLPA